MGSHHHIDILRLCETLLGMILVIGSGCVFNNVIDRDIDALMERTQKRIMPRGLLSIKSALIYGVILGLLGFLVLLLTTNPLTTLMAFIGFFVYVVIYSLCLKRRSTFGTTLGGIAGSIPPVVGYCAATNRFDAGAILLFLILFCWQLPHFYAISIYRLKDFAAASLPILPLTKGLRVTKICMLLYIIAFGFFAVLPSALNIITWTYGSIALIIFILWLLLGIEGFTTTDDNTWARKFFLFSIISITALCIAMLA